MSKTKTIFSKPTTKSDMALELITWGIIITIIMYTIIMWSKIPASVPIHFNLKGEPDNYGSKFIALLIGFIPIALFYFGVSFVEKHPEWYNYTIEITDYNKKIQYKMAHTFMRVIKLVLVMWFSAIQYSTIVTAQHPGQRIIKWLTPTAIIVIILSLSIYLVFSVRYKSGSKTKSK